MDKYITKEFSAVHIRVTAQEGLTIDPSLVESKFDGTFSKYIIGFELNHFHVCLVVRVKDGWLEGSKHKKLRDWVNNEIRPLVHKTGRFNYSISVAKTEKQLAKYTVKDGNYVYKGFTATEVKKFEISSFRKGKGTYNQEKSDITERYMEDKIGDAEFFERMLKLNSDYGYSSYINHMRAYHITKKAKKDPEWRRQYSKYQVQLFLMDEGRGID